VARAGALARDHGAHSAAVDVEVYEDELIHDGLGLLPAAQHCRSAAVPYIRRFLLAGSAVHRTHRVD
jgi:hypothetical protein